jgi:hypothetical protein
LRVSKGSALSPPRADPAARFGYVPPVLEALGLAEVEHDARNNRMRAG